ncbi:hypothetical protein D3C74_486040 [compost metagenome]
MEICITMLLVSTEDGVKSVLASCGVLPITITTAIVSPTARVMPRMTAEIMPLLAAGRTTRIITCRRVEPRA